MQTDLPTPHALVPEQIPLKSSVLQATVSAAQVFWTCTHFFSTQTPYWPETTLHSSKLFFSFSQFAQFAPNTVFVQSTVLRTGQLATSMLASSFGLIGWRRKLCLSSATNRIITASMHYIYIYIYIYISQIRFASPSTNQQTTQSARQNEIANLNWSLDYYYEPRQHETASS